MKIMFYVEGTNFIKEENGVIKVDGAEVCERWRGYFQELLNGENECEFGEEGAVEGPLNKWYSSRAVWYDERPA